MTLPVVVIRPEPGCSATVSRARASGLRACGFPLSQIEPRAWRPPAGDMFDALIVGSASVFRYGGASLADVRGKPVYAVGETTAAAARESGFTVALTGTGGLQGALDVCPAPLRLLRLAGEEHVALDLPRGVTLHTRVVYAAVPQPMPAELADALQRGAIVLLHSAASAGHFAAECARLALPRQSIVLAALGPRILPAAGEGWLIARAAELPNNSALLALTRDLCHELGGGEGI